MKLEHYSKTKLKNNILKVVKKHLDTKSYKIFYFGSRVRGDSFERADIDLGIEGPAKIPAGIKLKIQEELDNLPLLYKIDLVDFRNVSKKFKNNALKYKEYVK